MALLTVKNLCLGYESRVIVKDLNFSVPDGSYLCIVGENGSGKTTLMRTLLGLQKPLSGTIETAEGLRQNEIGWLPQQTTVQKDFPASVEEVVLSGCLSRRKGKFFFSAEEKKRAADNMQRMGVTDLKNRCYRELSGGQQQRVLLARALCAAEKVLLLDEPVSGLDPYVTKDMYELIQKLNREGMTILMISHDIDAALRYATHILHIGDRVFFCKKEDYPQGKDGGSHE